MFNKKKSLDEINDMLEPRKEESVVGKFLRVQDVMGMFKYNYNPSYIDAKVEAEVAKIKKEQRSVPMQWIFIIIIVIIVGAVAFSIVNGSLQGTSCQADLKACWASTRPAANILTNAAGSSVSTIG